MTPLGRYSATHQIKLLHDETVTRRFANASSQQVSWKQVSSKTAGSQLHNLINRHFETAWKKAQVKVEIDFDTCVNCVIERIITNIFVN